MDRARERRRVSCLPVGYGYTYDANGNRLTQTGSSAAGYAVSSTSNRVTSITGTPTRTYGYDPSGNVTSYGGLSFTYTDAGRMSSVTSSAVTTTYLVNALGQRVRKSNATATVHFVYDESGHLLGEYDATGALAQETIWMGETPVATLRPNGSGVDVYYVHTDHLNTPRRISRPSDNAILWRWDSDPFGTAAANEDPDGDTTTFGYNLRFPGQYFDAESGLSYNYARSYDPVAGRYLEPDPLLQPNRWLTDDLAFFVPILMRTPGWLHPYAYVHSQPVGDSDPLGLGPWGIIKCLWYGEKIDKYNKQCRAECPRDMEGEIKFMQKYESAALSDALLTCTCSKAEAAGEKDLCAKFFATCLTSALGGPPRPR